jgi:hypothetical protein
MKTGYPESEAEFLRFIEDIDADLKRQGILIIGRPIAAIQEVCKRLKTSLPVVPNGLPIPGNYYGKSLSAHIQAWYERIYGKRLGMDLSPGSIAVLIRDDLWKINFPRLYGGYRFLFVPFPEKEEELRLLEQGDAYPLHWIEGLTVDYARSLTTEEVLKIKGTIIFSLRALWRLSEVEHQKFLPQARADLSNAVSSLFLPLPNFGQSKWASLQFAEKLFKSLLDLKHIPFPTGNKGHDVTELARLSEQSGLKGYKPVLADLIQCKSGVRYGEIAVGAADAINAHHASLVVCDIVCVEIGNLTGNAKVPKIWS